MLSLEEQADKIINRELAKDNYYASVMSDGCVLFHPTQIKYDTRNTDAAFRENLISLVSDREKVKTEIVKSLKMGWQL